MFHDEIFDTVLVKSTNPLLMVSPLLPYIVRDIDTGEVFVSLLEPLTISTNKDSFSFCEKLKNFDYNLVMTSFDAESLFTNISLQEMIDFSYQKLFEDKNYIDALYKIYFSEMLTVTKTDSFTLFDNEYYR